MTANVQKIRACQFRVFGLFREVEDRSLESYNPGLFFHVDTICGSFEVKVPKKLFDEAPSPGTELWLVGNAFTTRFCDVDLQVTEFFEPNERMPEPSSEDQMRGAWFQGITSIEKSTFRRNNGETCYKLLVRGLGFLYSYVTDDEKVYRLFPGDELILLRGRLKLDQTYRQDRRRTIYVLTPTDFVQPRREAEPSPSDSDNSKPKPERRQAPQDKQN